MLAALLAMKIGNITIIIDMNTSRTTKKIHTSGYRINWNKSGRF